MCSIVRPSVDGMCSIELLSVLLFLYELDGLHVWFCKKYLNNNLHTHSTVHLRTDRSCHLASLSGSNCNLSSICSTNDFHIIIRWILFLRDNHQLFWFLTILRKTWKKKKLSSSYENRADIDLWHIFNVHSLKSNTNLIKGWISSLLDTSEGSLIKSAISNSLVLLFSL